MHKISNRIFEIFFKKTLDFLLAGSRYVVIAPVVHPEPQVCVHPEKQPFEHPPQLVEQPSEQLFAQEVSHPPVQPLQPWHPDEQEPTHKPVHSPLQPLWLDCLSIIASVSTNLSARSTITSAPLWLCCRLLSCKKSATLSSGSIIFCICSSVISPPVTGEIL